MFTQQPYPAHQVGLDPELGHVLGQSLGLARIHVLVTADKTWTRHMGLHHILYLMVLHQHQYFQDIISPLFPGNRILVILIAPGGYWSQYQFSVCRAIEYCSGQTYSISDSSWLRVLMWNLISMLIQIVSEHTLTKIRFNFLTDVFNDSKYIFKWQ